MVGDVEGKMRLNMQQKGQTKAFTYIGKAKGIISDLQLERRGYIKIQCLSTY